MKEIWTWWHMLVFPALGSWRQEDQGFRVTLASAAGVLVQAAAAARHDPFGVCKPVYSPCSCSLMTTEMQPQWGFVITLSLSLKPLASLLILSCHWREVCTESCCHVCTVLIFSELGDEWKWERIGDTIKKIFQMLPETKLASVGPFKCIYRHFKTEIKSAVY